MHQFQAETLKELHQYAEPYEDPNATVMRLIGLLKKAALPNRSQAEGVEQSQVIGLYDGSDLKHTKVLSAKIGDQDIVRPKWNSIMAVVCTKAIAIHSLEWMRMRKAPSVVPGKRKDSGFHHLPGTDASVQYTDATKAWGYTRDLAQQLELPIEVVFEWRDKEQAARPGETSRVTYDPKINKP